MPAYADQEFWDEVEAELAADECGGMVEFVDGPIVT